MEFGAGLTQPLTQLSKQVGYSKYLHKLYAFIAKSQGEEPRR